MLTFSVSGLALEEDAESSLKVECLTTNVIFASTEAIGKLKHSSLGFQDILWRTVHPAGNKLKGRVHWGTVLHAILRPRNSQQTQQNDDGTQPSGEGHTRPHDKRFAGRS